MTPEQRLDRLERIARLFVGTTLRERKLFRELGEKINIVLDSQIKRTVANAALVAKSESVIRKRCPNSAN